MSNEIFGLVARSGVIDILREANVEVDRDDSDKSLVAGLFDLDPSDLFYDMLPGFERRLLDSLLSAGGVAALEAGLRDGAPTQDGSMLREIHRRMSERGESPIAHWFAAEIPVVEAAAPRG